MSKKAMCQLVTDIAALPVFMMCIIVNDGRLQSDMGHHGRKFTILCRLKHRAVAGKFGHAQDVDFKFSADSRQINAISRR